MYRSYTGSGPLGDKAIEPSSRTPENFSIAAHASALVLFSPIYDLSTIRGQGYGCWQGCSCCEYCFRYDNEAIAIYVNAPGWRKLIISRYSSEFIHSQPHLEGPTLLRFGAYLAV